MFVPVSEPVWIPNPSTYTDLSGPAPIPADNGNLVASPPKFQTFETPWALIDKTVINKTDKISNVFFIII
jgi:hypothetical protein